MRTSLFLAQILLFTGSAATAQDSSTTLAPFEVDGAQIACSSATQSLSYTVSAPEGGAPRPTTYKLVVDGTVLIDKGLFPGGGTEIETATVSFSGRGTKLRESISPDYRVRVGTKLMTVITIEELPRILFSDFVICRTSRYIGLPRP